MLKKDFTRTEIGNAVMYYSKCGHFIISCQNGLFSLMLDDNYPNQEYENRYRLIADSFLRGTTLENIINSYKQIKEG